MRALSIAIAAVVAAATAAGCSGGSPCSACPKIEGTYAMTYQPPTVESTDCAGLPGPEGPATIAITRSGAEVRSTFYGVSARGMLQDTSDFSISGTSSPEDGGTQQSYTLRGYYVPPKATGLPGTIEGKWITHGERGSKVCDVERAASGQQQQ
jgi:hypothetical protein